MTIVVGVATPEGLVLASDSRTTLNDGERHHRIASDYGQKVFTVGPMGVATFGAAFLGSDTIAGVMDQFAAEIASQGDLSVDAFSSALGKFFTDQLNAALGDDEWDTAEDGYPLGFLVAGYGGDGVGSIRQVLIPGPEIGSSPVATTVEGGAMWRGQTDVIARLIKGIDLQAADELGISLPEESREALAQLEYVPLHPITVQDGIDYAGFLVRTTIDMQRFSDGIAGNPGNIPGCGGDPQILVIERSLTTWVSRLSLLPPSPAGRAEGATSV